MLELRLLRPAETTTKPDRLQYRTFDQVEGWTHSNWSEWKDVPIVVRGQASREATPVELNGSSTLETGGSVTYPVDLPGFECIAP